MSAERTPASLLNPPPTFEVAFADALEICKEIYESHNRGRRDGWKTEPEDFFLVRLHEELIEYIRNPSAREAADMVNFCLMLTEFQLRRTSK